MAKSYYEKPVHSRVAQRILESMISTAVVYLISPQLLGWLAPLQAKMNATALNNGQTPPTQGANAVANTLIAPVTPPGTITIPSNTGT
jgi:hypothetical protein